MRNVLELLGQHCTGILIRGKDIDDDLNRYHMPTRTLVTCKETISSLLTVLHYTGRLGRGYGAIDLHKGQRGHCWHGPSWYMVVSGGNETSALHKSMLMLNLALISRR